MELLREHLISLQLEMQANDKALDVFCQDWESKIKHGMTQIREWLKPVDFYANVLNIDRAPQEVNLTFRGRRKQMSLDGLRVRIGDHLVNFLPELIMVLGGDPCAAKIVIKNDHRCFELQYLEGGWRLVTRDGTEDWNQKQLERLLLESNRLTL
jgi:hypothetical protein